MVEATMVCFHCGKEEAVEMSEPAQFGVDVANASAAVGFISCFDMYRGRILVFCDEKCAKAHIGRNGAFKLRPGKPTA